MRLLVNIAIIIGVMLLLPFAIAAAKKSLRGKGRLGGAALAIGLAFGGIFDPVKSAAMEHVEKRREAGGEEDGNDDSVE